MNLWIVAYTHKYGGAVWPRFQEDRPDRDEEIRELADSWEGEDGGDYLDIDGPFAVPDTDSSIAIEALQAIWARIEGDFGHPALVKLGPLGRLDGDIGTLANEALRQLGRLK